MIFLPVCEAAEKETCGHVKQKYTLLSENPCMKQTPPTTNDLSESFSMATHMQEKV
jgi:hypothetical protein